MISRLARFVITHRKGVLAGALIALIASFAVGGKVASKLNNGGFADPHASSTLATNLLDSRFHAGSPNVVLVATARQGTVDSTAATAAGLDLTRRLAGAPYIEGAASYWSAGAPPPLASRDHRQALVLARLTGNDDQVNTRIKALLPEFNGTHGALTVQVTGQAAAFHQVGETIRSDLARAEGYAVPIVVILLLFVFGSLVASALPLAIGALSVGGTFAILTGLAAVTKVSIFSLNLTTAMSLGLAVDYSLFVVYRFREELAAGKSTEAAVLRTMETAGRTVMFSAATVAVSLAALLVFPLYFLKSFAYAGIAVVLVAAVGAVVVLPALLATLGPRVDSFAVLRRPARSTEIGRGFWHRLATTVMRRPLPIAVAIIAVLLFLGAPFLGVHFGQPDDRVLPKTASTRIALDDIRTHFASNESNAMSIVAPDAGNPASHQAQVTAYATALSEVPGVARVDAYTGSFIGGAHVVPATTLSKARFGNASGTWLSAVPTSTIEPQSAAGEHLVHEVRAVVGPWKVQVAGTSPQLVDSKRAIFSKVPWALGIIAIVTLVTLFLMFGSILVPIKAVVLNLLSLTATFGAMVWVFQRGHASGLLNFTPTGTLDTTTPILMFCIAFGLSMDYEVFLLSRIKEEHDGGADTGASVAAGLEHTGRIVTAAAALLAVVFVAFATSHITFIKLFGLGLALAVLMDATLIRGTLVPAFMRLAGNANWWAPGPLRRFHDRFGISESAPQEPPAAPTGSEATAPRPGRPLEPIIRRERPLRARR
ncbi:MAG: MMPL family transporter [Acidimicrobiales bacterium]